MRYPTEIISYTINRLRRRRVWKFTREAMKRQWWPRNDLLRLGENRARSLAIHALSNVPYYTQIFQNLAINPANMNFPKEWETIPILDKDTLRSQFDMLTARTRHALRALMNASGGSTGKPVSFLTDLTLYDIMEANLNLVFSWAGWKPGEMCIHLWGGRKQKFSQGFLGYIRTSLAGRLVLPVYSYDENLFESWWQIVNTYKPTIIYAYPSVAAEFAAWLTNKRYKIKGIKGVFCSAETLFQAQREVIEQGFDCKVYNQYGSRETPAVACECPEGNMHVFVDVNYVEFLNQSNGKDELQKIVVTPLYNYAQPLIRYDLDDVGSSLEGSCPCGRGYPLMNMEIGRQNDHLLSQDGKRIYPSFFLHLLDGKKWISQFQFRQAKLDTVDLIIEANSCSDIEGHKEVLVSEVLPHLRRMMGNRTKLNLTVVHSIDRTPAGKFRHVINEME
ncbi:MAG: phenylacetate--CoA ligase family protein [Candidatus Hodarchaeota archaeon]